MLQSSNTSNLETPYICLRRKIAYTTICTFWIAVPFIIYDLKIENSTESTMNTTLSVIFGFNLSILAICLLRTVLWSIEKYITYEIYEIFLIFFIYLLTLATIISINYLVHFYIAITVFFLYCIYSITHTITMGFIIYDLYLKHLLNRALDNLIPN